MCRVKNEGVLLELLRLQRISCISYALDESPEQLRD